MRHLLVGRIGCGKTVYLESLLSEDLNRKLYFSVFSSKQKINSFKIIPEKLSKFEDTYVEIEKFRDEVTDSKSFLAFMKYEVLDLAIKNNYLIIFDEGMVIPEFEDILKYLLLERKYNKVIILLQDCRISLEHKEEIVLRDYFDKVSYVNIKNTEEFGKFLEVTTQIF